MKKNHFRKTNIIATLGPASASPEMVEKLFTSGANVFRLNMSHGDHGDKKKLIKIIRSIEKKHNIPIAIMVDLQGPKIRCGIFKNDKVHLNNGATFILDNDPTPGNETRVCLPHPEIFEIMKPGLHILIDDGKVRLEVQSIKSHVAKTKVLVGGDISNKKGVNIPEAVLPISALTQKDLKDLNFAISQNVDWIALSFVQRPSDISEARKIIRGRAGVLAKIEKPAAIIHLNEILEISDAVMVARGDLGVEMPLEEVPGIQKHIIYSGRKLGKPVVVATQMMESMITSPVPTRAEVSDVANAVYDDADAVMLSAESAVGNYPAEVVSMMEKIILQVESDPTYILDHMDNKSNPDSTPEDAITAAARQVSSTIGAAAIVTFTTSGATALRAARERPGVPILALTPKEKVARQLCLVWGLNTLITKDVNDFEELLAKSKRMALRSRLASGGDRIVVTAGVPFGTPGATNVLHIALVQGNELDGH
ncbi:MAG: pyruvate kinase [Sphingomonadales bacterium]